MDIVIALKRIYILKYFYVYKLLNISFIKFIYVHIDRH